MVSSRSAFHPQEIWPFNFSLIYQELLPERKRSSAVTYAKGKREREREGVGTGRGSRENRAAQAPWMDTATRLPRVLSLLVPPGGLPVSTAQEVDDRWVPASLVLCLTRRWQGCWG